MLARQIIQHKFSNPEFWRAIFLDIASKRKKNKKGLHVAEFVHIHHAAAKVAYMRGRKLTKKL